MAELDTIAVYNPLSEEYVSTFNGESYKIPAETEKYLPKFLALHVAKGISDKLLAVDLLKIKKEKNANAFNPKNAQLMIYDNPRRRMTLFDTLRSKALVQDCIEAFPFKGFIGEMSDYDRYVEKKAASKSEE